jgi:hypothetical protein
MMPPAGVAHLISADDLTASLWQFEVTFSDFSLGRFLTPFPLLTLNG